MAILPDFPDVEVAIVVSGTALTEYNDANHMNEPGRITSYVESTSNTSFAVRVTVSSDTQTKMKGDVLAFDIFVDGHYVTMSLLGAEQLATGKPWQANNKGETVQGTLQPMRFSVSRVSAESDQDDVLGIVDTASPDDIGSISVIVRHAQIVEQTNNTATADAQSEFMEHRALPEDALKSTALPHSASLGAPDMPAWTLQCLHTEGKCAGTYHFKYRSKKSLEAMLGIPSTTLLPQTSEGSPSHKARGSRCGISVAEYARIISPNAMTGMKKVMLNTLGDRSTDRDFADVLQKRRHSDLGTDLTYNNRSSTEGHAYVKADQIKADQIKEEPIDDGFTDG